MTFLLDTHVFLWLAAGDARLSPETRDRLADAANTVYLSVASLWEIAIKSDLGKLRLDVPAADMARAMGVGLLAVREQHVHALEGLPHLHRDPFDRLLVATSRAENCVLVSHDTNVLAYPVAVLAV